MSERIVNFNSFFYGIFIGFMISALVATACCSSWFWWFWLTVAFGIIAEIFRRKCPSKQ